MTNKIIKLIFCLTTLLSTVALVAAPTSREFNRSSDQLTQYPQQLSSVINKIHQSSEARELIAKAQQRGPIRVQANHNLSRDFHAYWEGSGRVICVTMSKQVNEGSLISSIIFELHNAVTDARLEQLTHMAMDGKISKDRYVELIERMEHENAVNAVALLKKGIQRGVFPQSAGLEVIKDFEDHYKTQQLAGHSQWIAAQYDQYNPRSSHIAFAGTIPDLHRISDQDKQKMLYYYSLKVDLLNPDQETSQQAKQQVQKELQKLQLDRSNVYSRDPVTRKNQSLFQHVFGNQLGAFSG